MLFQVTSDAECETAIFPLWDTTWRSIVQSAHEQVAICDCVCINHPFSAKVVDTLPLYTYISNSENLNIFRVESLDKKLKTSAYSVYISLFNSVYTYLRIRTICVVYANMVTYSSLSADSLSML